MPRSFQSRIFWEIAKRDRIYMGQSVKSGMGLDFGSGRAARTEWWPEGWKQRTSLVPGGFSKRRRCVPMGARPSGATLRVVRTLQT